MLVQAPELFIKRVMKADRVQCLEQVQSLWSGYGHLSRYRVTTADKKSSVILKAIDWSKALEHPRGWQSDLAHQRKVMSYKVELEWYENWSKVTTGSARVPHCLANFAQEAVVYLLLEDLDASGFHVRCASLESHQAGTVLQWLASLHAHYLVITPNVDWPKGLWPQGTYWHLATRPDEWQAMAEGQLKVSAQRLDDAIRACSYQTLVHGDAKVANFCFNEDLSDVAAVDFQYIGRGIGVQDVAYFLGSCLSEAQLEADIDYLLDIYFSELARCIIARGESPDLAESVTQEWYRLFPVAWADFHRFIMGWCPTHRKNTNFSLRITQTGLDQVSL